MANDYIRATIAMNLTHCHASLITYNNCHITQHTNGPRLLGAPTVPAHLAMSSGVQLVHINGQLHHFSMTVPSCPVQHGETIVVSTVVQRLHLGSHVLDSADMATLCSQVESILSILQKLNAYNTSTHV